MAKPLVEPWLRRVLRLLVAIGFALVAANFCGRWWFWEVRVPAAHWALSPADRWSGRVSLAFALATLIAGFALYDLIGSLPEVRVRTRWALASTALIAAAGLLLGRWLESR